MTFASAKSAQVDAQTKLNAAQNAIAKVQKTYDDALAVKEQTPAAQAKVAELRKLLKQQKLNSQRLNQILQTCNKFVHNANLN